MRVLVMGAGSIGRRHLANLRALGVSDLVVYDPLPAARERAAREWDAVSVETEESALDREPEVVFICSPSHLHLRQARAVLGRAHLFVEKPLATESEGVPALLEADRRGRRVATVGHNMRFHPAVRRIREEMLAGAVGRPWVLSARFGHYLPNWRPGQDYRTTYSAHAAEGGGVVMDGLHDIDYVLWWGGEVREVLPFRAAVSGLDIDGEDYAAVLLRFTSGAVGHVQLDYLRCEKLRGAEIMGSAGVLVWESLGKTPEWVRVRRIDAETRRSETLLDLPAYDVNETYVAEVQHFFRAIRGAEPPQLTLADAAASLPVVLAARAPAGAAREREAGTPSR